MGIYEMKKPKRINSFSVTLFIVVASIAYLGYFFLPAYWPVFQMNGIMQGICNSAYREYDNEKLMNKLLKESQRTGLRLTKENFTLSRNPYSEPELGALPTQEARDIYQLRGKECVLSMDYVGTVEWPFTGKKAHMHWTPSVKIDLKVVKY